MKKDSNLSPAQIWDISAQAFHYPKYKKIYTQSLARIIGQKSRSILDTASGTGFPTIDLIKKGYKNISAIDADKDETRILKRRFKKYGINSRIYNYRWQELNKKKIGQYDIVINADNALVYIDSWSKDKFFVSKEAYSHISAVLKNFHSLVKPNGKLIVALAKNNKRGLTSKKIDLGRTRYEGDVYRVLWNLKYDWSRRTKVVEITVRDQMGRTYRRDLKSYLVTLEELTGLLKKAGFRSVIKISPRDVYDNLLVCIK